ncbi:hypothetical protein [Saccharothrix hoggarensis]|uniref:Uncharacterized protein n=1 Tax=Saccharothrix hoggarensis TaxID=913853 RepID=A0ABW3QMG3_9PSEU
MPAMSSPTSFVDGVLVHQADLNNLSVNIDTLTQLTQGKPAASGVSHKPMAMVKLTSPQPVNNSTDLIVPWHAEVYDFDNLWTPGSANRFSVQTSGKYVIRMGTDWSANATGLRTTKIFVNGTSNANTVAGYSAPPPSAFDAFYTVESPPVSLAAGASVYFDVFQSSGVTLDLGLSFGGTWASIEWVAPF